METLGQKFQAARERKRLSLSKAAALTRIKVQHLEKMEQDDFSLMPAPTYARGFIRIYAGLLGLDPEPLVQEYVDRHLGDATEEKSSTRRQVSEPASRVDTEGEEDRESAAARVASMVSAVKQKFPAIVPHLPRMAVALVALFLLVGIVRCAARMRSGDESAAAAAAGMDSDALMKEPPVRYLDTPATGDAQP